MTWSKRFDVPIALPGRRQLVTLRDAGRYIERLPGAEHDLPHWKNAVEALLLVVEHNGPAMLARIGMMQALNYGRPKPQQPPRKKRVKAYRILR